LFEVESGRRAGGGRTSVVPSSWRPRAANDRLRPRERLAIGGGELQRVADQSPSRRISRAGFWLTLDAQEATPRSASGLAFVGTRRRSRTINGEGLSSFLQACAWRMQSGQNFDTRLTAHPRLEPPCETPTPLATGFTERYAQLRPARAPRRKVGARFAASRFFARRARRGGGGLVRARKSGHMVLFALSLAEALTQHAAATLPGASASAGSASD